MTSWCCCSTRSENRDIEKAINTDGGWNPYDKYKFAIYLCTLVLFTFAAVALTTLVFYLIFSAIYNAKLPEFGVESVSVSPVNASSLLQVPGNWDITFSVRNPNEEISISYRKINVSLLYKNRPFSETWVSSFYQEKYQEEDAKIRARFTVFEDGYTGMDRNSELLEFAVSMEILVQFHPHIGNAYVITVYCSNLEVSRSSFKPCTVTD